MKTIRYLLFVPAFFIITVLARILEGFILRLINLIYQMETTIWADFVVIMMSVGFGIEVALRIFPKENKKVGFLILTALSLLSVIYYISLVFAFEESTRLMKISAIIDTVAHLIAFIYMFTNLKKDDYILD
ncbi:hypothetical protein [Chryseobacterium daeguense]|uniref:hypothetical protein n=1 Tax=Chryseobacterium daeguense TaxID=412438 RepID=UPI000480654D|nr:hypothetical protein [Chryseobacterium daeguense]